jgi:hypothetical protein
MVSIPEYTSEYAFITILLYITHDFGGLAGGKPSKPLVQFCATGRRRVSDIDGR